MMLAAVALAGTSLLARAGQSATQKPQVYAKEQADRGAKQYEKLCAACHDPGKTPPAGKDKGPELVGDKFTSEWQDRTVGELAFTILTSMPNDGSAVLSASETADLVAHILQANGYPDGPTPLKYDASDTTPIVK
ncbi:MAG: cytochrome c [Vicinamibacterales bacterium]